MADESLESQASSTTSAPMIGENHTYASISDAISSIPIFRPSPRVWYIGFGIGFLLTMVLLFAITYLIAVGVGIWGVNIPVAWGFAIVNFVWCIGIGHAGTLISAILLLMHQKWRTSINRFAEAMTLFAVACAGMFPLLHLGRPWVFYWLFPYPDTMTLWPQFRSPLVWDVFAVSTYFTVSLIFWYVGLIPDVGTMRDRARRLWVKRVYGILAMGWRGSAVHWERYQMAYLLLAGLATPLVVSVHSIVSLDFASAQLPGWHSTIFPPYFVAGAIYSGFAMVLTLTIPIRKIYKLEDFITLRHLDYMGRLMLGTGLVVAYGYVMETFMAWYSGNIVEKFMMLNRLLGPYAWAYWLVLLCNVAIPQLLWFRRVRTSAIMLFIMSLVVNLGMWLERFVIVVGSLNRAFMPSAWHMYYPTRWDYATLFGSIGFFVACMFLFVRLLPMIAMHEMSDLLHGEREKESEAT
jgi:Ni/Fe-hydrogenase subunit HybB-like protein